LLLLLLIEEKYIVHMEMVGKGEVIDGPEELNPINKIRNKIRCAHDVCTLYKRLGYQNIYIEDMEDGEKFIVVSVEKQNERS